jgi:hypothetical protein
MAKVRKSNEIPAESAQFSHIALTAKGSTTTQVEE